MKRFALAGLILTALLGNGCAVETNAADPEVGSTPETLFRTGSLWGGTISVCFDQVTSSTDITTNSDGTKNDYRPYFISPISVQTKYMFTDVQRWVTDGWNAPSAYGKFTGWGLCPWSNEAGRNAYDAKLKAAGSSMIAVRLYNVAWSSWSPVGRQPGLNQIVLTENWDLPGKRRGALHEFGHALGYHHDFMWSGAPYYCGELERQATNSGGPISGNYMSTSFDWESIMLMAYCNNVNDISMLDMIGHRKIYSDIPTYALPFDDYAVHAAYWGNYGPAGWTPGGASDMWAQCAAGDTAVGLSTNMSYLAHSELCMSNSYGYKVRTNPSQPGQITKRFDTRDASRGGTDWAYGDLKGECDVNYAITGIAQNPSRRVYAIQCSPLDFTVTAESTTTYTRQVGGKNDGFYGTDWAYGYWKAQCDNGDWMIGISAKVSNGQPTKIKCVKRK